MVADFSQRWSDVWLRIAEACERSGRAQESVKVVSVTKTVSIDDMIIPFSMGVRHFGENRLQSSLAKIHDMRYKELTGISTWHFIGRLQRNKCKDVILHFQYLHSLDRLSLAYTLNTQCLKYQKSLNVFIQVNITCETSKTGFSPNDLGEAIEAIDTCSNLHLMGFMTMAPRMATEHDIRLVFRELRYLRDKWQKKYRKNFLELSMGMSQDFVIAVEEGATWLRIGSSLFPSQEK